MGRWSWIQIQPDTKRSIVFVTAYQTVTQRKKELEKGFSAGAQQYSILCRQGRSMHPREAFILDLREQLKQWRKQGRQIVLAGDFNEHLGNKDSGIAHIADEFGLVDAYHATRGAENELESYHRGFQRIDYVLATPAVINSIENCGILPFGAVIESDHRGIYVDFRTDELLGTPCMEASSIQGQTSFEESTYIN